MEALVGLFGIIPLAIFGAVVAFAVVTEQRQKKEFFAALEVDPDVVAIAAKGASAQCRTKRPPFIEVKSAGGGKNNPTRWDARGIAFRVAARTTLHLSREGSLGALREMLGFKDVHVGDEDFDKAFTVRGSEPDVVRGLFASVEVKDALRAFFAVPAWNMHIDDEGLVKAQRARRKLDADEAKQFALALARVVELLELHADDPAIASPSPLLAGATGGASGAPVGVSIGSSA